MNRHPAEIGVYKDVMREPGLRRVSFFCIFLIAGVWILLPSAMASEMASERGRWAILISGVSGDPELQKTYLQEITDLHSVLESSLGFPRDNIAVLFDDPSKKPDLIKHKSTREELENVSRDFARRVKKDDFVFVFIEGHGGYDGRTYKLNLVGPDPNGEDLAAMLYSIPARELVVVNVTNCSGGSIPAFSGPGKIIMTATKSGMEKNQTHAGRYFVDALRNNAADSDKDGRVSVLEAFVYTRQKIEDYYKAEGNLQTEHPVLDDNGDGMAQTNPTPENGEGLLARTTYLSPALTGPAGLILTAEQRKLLKEVQDLERQIEALKYAKGEMPEADYELKLEELMLKLAKTNAKLPR